MLYKSKFSPVNSILYNKKKSYYTECISLAVSDMIPIQIKPRIHIISILLDNIFLEHLITLANDRYSETTFLLNL